MEHVVRERERKKTKWKDRRAQLPTNVISLWTECFNDKTTFQINSECFSRNFHMAYSQECSLLTFEPLPTDSQRIEIGDSDYNIGVNWQIYRVNEIEKKRAIEMTSISAFDEAKCQLFSYNFRQLFQALMPYHFAYRTTDRMPGGGRRTSGTKFQTRLHRCLILLHMIITLCIYNTRNQPNLVIWNPLWTLSQWPFLFVCLFRYT